MSIRSDQEDLYSLLKDLLDTIKGLTTAQIDTQVNGGAVAQMPSGSSPVVNAAGTNPGVGLAKTSSQKLDELAERLDKLLQQSEKPQSIEEQTQKKEESKAAQAQQSSSANNDPLSRNNIGVFELELGVSP